jgi:hypothetical protein
MMASVRQGMTALREPRRARRVAMGLWIAWAFLTWNVVFDHVIVVAGREYLVAAGLAARSAGPYARLDDWMHPAVARAAWVASACAAVILTVGWVGIRFAGRRKPAPTCG